MTFHDDWTMITELPKLPPRSPDSHKGSFGRVLVVGGSRNYLGAPSLAANSALRGGAGLVAIAAPENVVPYIAALVPCATWVPLAVDARGCLDEAAIDHVIEESDRSTVLAVGPGLSLLPSVAILVEALLALDKPVVLDADGLNALAGLEDWPRGRLTPMLLTPHPGEFSRLTGKGVADIQDSRLTSAVAAVREWNPAGGDQGELVLLLKGHETIVTDGTRVYINHTGNPGMATGGTGDVLTGLCAALVAQGLGLFEAACLGANVHGLAGDLAAAKYGQVSLIATDLLEFLPAAIQKHQG